MSRLDHGWVDIELGGETATLKPTLGAMQAINRRFGDLRAALQRVQAMDFEAVAFILSAGLGKKDVSEAAFETGMINLVPPAANYLANLLNPSGRDSSGESDDLGKGRACQ